MADKSFGVKDINLIGASGTPEIESPNNLNINAVNVAISTDMSVGGELTVADKIIHTGDTNTAIRFPANDTVTVETAGTERVRVTSDGNIGIGTAQPLGKLHIQNADSGGSVGVSADELVIENSDYAGITLLSNTQGLINFADSSDVNVGNITYDHASNFMNFKVNDGERLRITSAGNVNIIDGNLVVASGHGIDFSAGGNAGGMTSELLDDYEEGTWTPTLGGNSSCDIETGTYTKIGNIVYAYCRIRPTSLGTGSSNTISGLPFTCNNDNGGVMIGYYDGSAVSSVEIGGVVNSNGSIGLFTKTSATNNTGTGAFFQNNCRIYLSTVYQTSS